MQYKSAHDLSHRPAAAPDEIEVSPGTLAESPKRVREKDAVRTLVEIHREEKKLAKEVEARQAKLAAARESALELQEQLDSLTESRAQLIARISRAESELAEHQHRMDGTDKGFADYWSRGVALGDGIAEYLRRQWMCERLVILIEQDRKAVAELNGKIDAFKTEHGIGPSK